MLSIQLRERGQMRVARDEDVYRRGIKRGVHRRFPVSLHDLLYLVHRLLGRGVVRLPLVRAHRSQGPAQGASQKDEKDREHRQDHQGVEAHVDEDYVELRQLAVAPDQARSQTLAQRDEVDRHPVGYVGHQEGDQEVLNHLPDKVVEVPARDPTRYRHERVDHLYLRKIQARGDLPVWRDAPGEVHDDVVAERRVQAVVVVLDGVGGIQLVAVLAVDHTPLATSLHGGEIVVGELVHQPQTPQGLLDSGIPEGLGIVVARKVDDPFLFPLPESAQGGEHTLVLGARNRERGPVLTFRHLAYLEKIEEVPGQDQLHRTLA